MTETLEVRGQINLGISMMIDGLYRLCDVRTNDPAVQLRLSAEVSKILASVRRLNDIAEDLTS